MSPIPSGADRALASLLHEHGIVATPGQLIGWRQAGLLGERVGEDQGYCLDIVERARAARRLVDANPRKLYVAVLTMFAEGEFAISTTHLQSAYFSAFSQLERDLIRTAGTSDLDNVALDAADALAKRIAREPSFAPMRGRIPPRGRSPQREPRTAILSSIAANVLNVTLTGRAISDEATSETIDFLGLTSALSEIFSDEAMPDAETFHLLMTEQLADLDICRLRQRIAALTSDQLAAYRDDARLLGELAANDSNPTVLRASMRNRHAIDLALAAVKMSILDNASPDAYQALVTTARTASNADSM